MFRRRLLGGCLSEMTAENTSSPEFMRRKFTLPESFDKRLQDLAAQHYSGNVSLCIRAAIEDHESTLTDKDSLSLHRIERQIDSLDTDIQALADTPSTTSDQETTVQGHNKFGNLGFDEEMSTTMHRVHSEFGGDGLSLRLADLVERIEDSPESIVRACEQLLDLGFLVESDQPRRYRQPTLEGSP